MKWLFLPLQAGKGWHGATIHTDPLGGSEAAVAYTARALAKKGESVWVLTHGVEQQAWFDDVAYVPNSMFTTLLGWEWDVVVSSRWIEVLSHPWKTKVQSIWLHDLPQNANTRLNANLAVFVSNYQAGVWGFGPMVVDVTPPNHCTIYNGVDEVLFDNLGELPRDENKLIWTSNPERGVPIAARIFQEIRKRWPDLELHIYGSYTVYGWEKQAEAPYVPDEQFMENVFYHDPLPRYALAKELKTSWAMFYPTWWPETFCIAGLESQMAGTPVITVPIGAANETIRGGIVGWDILNSVSQLRNVRRWKKLSEAGVEWARQNTWNVQAGRWIDEAQSRIEH